MGGIPSLRYVDCTPPLGVINRLDEGALNPTVYVFDDELNSTGPSTDP